MCVCIVYVCVLDASTWYILPSAVAVLSVCVFAFCKKRMERTLWLLCCLYCVCYKSEEDDSADPWSEELLLRLWMSACVWGGIQGFPSCRPLRATVHGG